MECWELWKDSFNIVKFKDLEWKTPSGTLHSMEWRSFPETRAAISVLLEDRTGGKVTHAKQPLVKEPEWANVDAIFKSPNQIPGKITGKI